MKKNKLNILKRNKQVNILLSELEFYNLQKKCFEMDIKVSTYVRKLVLNDLNEK